MLKKVFVSLLLPVLALTGLKAEDPISIIQFDKIQKKFNTPNGWYPFRQKTFLPLPAISYPVVDGKKVMKIGPVKGKSGCRFDSYRKFSAIKGDKIILTAEVRGKGQGFFTVQAYSGKTWTGHIAPAVKFPITREWKKVPVEVMIDDVFDRVPTDKVICLFGLCKGAEAEIRSITYEKISPISGDTPFPNLLTGFLPMDPKYTPTQKELTTLPATLNGVKPRKIQLVGNEHDFAPDFQYKKGPLSHGAGNCAWLYAAIKADKAEDYTIGAGADWWMTLYVNGKKVLDTSKGGNVLHPPRVTDYTRKVRLKKGLNILAVKYVTGAGTKFALGGPQALRNVGKKYRIVEELVVDNFEKKMKRKGDPEIIQGAYSYALVDPSRQGRFTAKPLLKFAPAKTDFTMPKIASGKSFGMSLRLVNFPRDGKKLAFFFRDGKKKDSFAALEIEPLPGGKNLSFILKEKGGKKEKGLVFPLSKLPCDLLFFADARGEYRISTESLADASSFFHNGTSRFFGSIDEKGFKVDAAWEALPGKKASLLLDDWIYGYVAADVMKRRIPMDIKVEKTFDPAKAGWKLILNEEFNSPKLNDDLWYTHSPENLEIKNGIMHVKVVEKNVKGGKLYKAGHFSSRGFYSYGYYEARVRFRRNPALTTAFWLYGGQTGNSYLDGMEIDIFEDYYVTKENPLLDFNFHGFVGRIMKSWNYTAKVPGSLEKFYTIGCKWTPMEITYYLDGKVIASSANHSPHKTVTFDALNHRNGFAPLRLAFCSKTRAPYNSKTPVAGLPPFPDEFLIDFVRVWEYPGNIGPRVTLAKKDDNLFVAPGEKFELEARILPNAKSKAPIKGVYLFDSGCLLDYKDKPPYKFTVSIDEKYYSGTTYMRTGRSRKKPNLKGVLHAYAIYAQDANGNVSHTPAVVKMTRPEKASRPYKGVAQKIPGKVNPCHYDEGGNGVGYLDDDVNVNKRHGFRVNEGVDATSSVIGHVVTGEWVNVTVDIKEAGLYKAVLDYGAPSGYGGSLWVTLDDKKFLGAFQLPPNRGNGWGGQKSTARFRLPAGRHTLKLIVVGAYNFSYLTFTKEK